LLLLLPQAARLCFDLSDLESGRFHIGSAEGELVAASFTKAAGQQGQQQQGGEAPGGGGSGGDSAPAAALSTVCCHCGPLVAVQRSPFLEGVMLTVGDWTFQIWREGDAAPLFVSPYAPECYTGGAPPRPCCQLGRSAAGAVGAGQGACSGPSLAPRLLHLLPTLWACTTHCQRVWGGEQAD
jgi:hypothetical protein